MRVRKCGGGALVPPWERVGRAHRIPGAARTLFLAAALHALGLAGSLNFRFPVSVFRSHSPSLVWKATFLQFPLDFTNIFPSVQGTSAASAFWSEKLTLMCWRLPGCLYYAEDTFGGSGEVVTRALLTWAQHGIPDMNEQDSFM